MYYHSASFKFKCTMISTDVPIKDEQLGEPWYSMVCCKVTEQFFTYLSLGNLFDRFN